MNFKQLFDDHSIVYLTEGHKHCRPGWMNMVCPFCDGNPGYHLGIRESGGWFYCWRCGSHKPDFVISTLLGISLVEARKLIKNYGTLTTVSEEVNKLVKIDKKAYKRPSGAGLLNPYHKRYLERRGFDPDYLVEKWKIKGLRPISYLDGIDYGNRIFIPVFWEGREVTFQTRYISEKHRFKYLACPEERELINIKEILYLSDNIGRVGICVEGVTDVWRFGDNSFALFGIAYKARQLRLISKMFDRVFVCFDDDPQAVKGALELVSELSFRGVEAYHIPILGDPAGMTQDDADYFVKDLIKKIF